MPVCACWACCWGQPGYQDQEAGARSVGCEGSTLPGLWASGAQAAAGYSPDGAERRTSVSYQLSQNLHNPSCRNDELPIISSTLVGNVLSKCILGNNCHFFHFFCLISVYHIYSSIMSFCISKARTEFPLLTVGTVELPHHPAVFGRRTWYSPDLHPLSEGL